MTPPLPPLPEDRAVSEAKLKPCPFCGRPATREIFRNTGPGWIVSIECTRCPACVENEAPILSRDVAVESVTAAWNRRPPHP